MLNEFFNGPKKIDKFQLTSQLSKQMKKFEVALEDFHEKDFFSKNETYCPYWKTDLYYSPTMYKWTCGNGKSLVENYRKTNHICCVKVLYEQIRREMNTKGRILGVDPISISFLLILELVQSSALVAYITHNKFLRNDESFLNHLLHNDDTTNIVLDRILTFYQEYINIQPNGPESDRSIKVKPQSKDYLISELPALPSVEIPKKDYKDFDDGAYDTRQNRDSYWDLPWKLIIPPISWSDKLSSINHPKLFGWNFYRQLHVDNVILKNPDNISVTTILTNFFPFLNIDKDYIEGIVDQRLIKNNKATITILFKNL